MNLSGVPNTTTVSLTAAIVCLVLVFTLSLPALSQIGKRCFMKKAEYQTVSERYEDEDGLATKDSEEAYSDFVPKLSLLLVSVIGTLGALALGILTTTRVKLSLTIESWLMLGAWLFLVLQVVNLFMTQRSTRRYDLGVYGGFSSLLLTIGIAVKNFSLWSMDAIPPPKNVHLTLTIIQLVGALVITICFLLIPRRPDVYRNGSIVDRQNTVSVLGKFTFTWATSLLTFAAKNKGLEYDDLHEIDHELRSKNLHDNFDAVGKKDKLWKAIFFSHKKQFILQWTLQVICSITNFLPQIALLYILRTLERRDGGEDISYKAWLLVIALGTSVTISSWIEAWMYFIVFMKIGIPVYEMIAAVVFGKAIRRKDVKSAGKKDEEKMSNGDIDITKDSGIKGDTTAIEEDEEESDSNGNPKSRQSTINLIGVDGKRISDFATFNYIILGSGIRLIFAFGFLYMLIGGIPLLAGVSVPVIIMPINIWVTKRYAGAQDDLMKYRDIKMAVVTEALQGIRQIKFSALERNWYEKIMDTRRKELKTQWRVFVFDTLLISVWIFGPVMLAGVALSVYAIINEELSASVAFTTISVFEAIEMTLAVLPELFTDLIDAKVSAGRIQKYLESAEKGDSTVEGDHVSFKGATIAWPSDNVEHEEEQFQLRNLDIDFPKHELSVISGKTGSGKSLLLASIFGEADCLEGQLTVPRPPPSHERYDDQATPTKWYIESAIAFVAQIPWIENATIRDNVLFGLPYYPSRYTKVLHACALEKDLEMLEDGEMTDIGANGINLSGGQKWRVSFARALYSRAGILVLDDIFSAVDANVGRHLFEKALTGELGQGRTRILVTHHVALCLPKTKYSVLLGNGTAIHAGSIEELRRTGRLKDILDHDVEEPEKKEEELDKQNSLTVDDGGGALQKMFSNQTRNRRPSLLSNSGRGEIQRKKSHATLEDGKQAPPKKFTEEEGRATGHIKWAIYAEYIRACGGFAYWAFIMLLFGIAIVVFLGRSWWISVWTRSYRTESASPVPFLAMQQSGVLHHVHDKFSAVRVDPNLWYYLGVYIGVSLSAWVIGTGRYFSVYIASIRASKSMFEKLAYAVLRAPLRWLDTMPVGRILNRFTSDFNMLDSRISGDLSFMLHNAMQVLSVVIAGLFVSPIMILFAVLLLVFVLRITTRYLAGAREVKRLESNAKSPVFEQFGSVLMGIGTIRAFDKADAYIERMYAKIDKHCRAYWHLWLFNRWMGFRLNMLGAAFATATAALIVGIPSVDASLAGFALSFALELSER
jgi:ABC-type multidrug transport system fused ATPase/permease subunit